MPHSTTVAILFSLVACPGDAVTNSAFARAARNAAGTDHRMSAANRRAVSLLELGADASMSSPRGISGHERTVMRQLSAKAVGGKGDASHREQPEVTGPSAAKQPVVGLAAQSESLAPAANASAVAELAVVVDSDGVVGVVAAEAAPAAEHPEPAADNATSQPSDEDAPPSDDVLSAIDKDLLATLSNASAVLANASHVADFTNASTPPEAESVDAVGEGGGNDSWSAWPGPLKAASEPTTATGVPPSPLDQLPNSRELSNATTGALDGELGRLITGLHDHIDNGVVPAAAKAEAKSAEYTKSLEELRDNIVSFKQGVRHFEDRAKAQHRAVMQRVQRALDAPQLAPALNSSAAGAPAQLEPAAPQLPASQAPSQSTAPSPAPSL